MEKRKAFKFVRLGQDLCDGLRRNMEADGYLGSFNFYVVSILAKTVSEREKQPKGDLKTLIQKAVEEQLEHIEVKAHRPKKDYEQRRQKAS